MLGHILGGLTQAAAAEELLASLADEALLARIRRAAEEHGVTPGTYVAAAVRQVLDHGSEEVWLDLVGKMAHSPQSGAAALQVILARAFPEEAAAPGCGTVGHGQPRPVRRAS